MRAISSLPVPDSPMISAVASVPAHAFDLLVQIEHDRRRAV
ncbi:hypothetical protein GGD41_006130 [Paraburkholderia bryophila]|uniref:Uncharacterized protein n=1 Tax=Paraburkholderia bryophila TaxID=420952 RepID=A0A7Y9WDV5_9BURK|nr:hypothetical protein [Paraburkholderia bryophila]